MPVTTRPPTAPPDRPSGVDWEVPAACPEIAAETDRDRPMK